MSRVQSINDALFTRLKPEVCQIVDETHRHHVPADAESHFKLIIVAEEFKNLKRIERHRLVNQLLANEFKRGLHALSLFLYSPDEWQNQGSLVPASPPCRDGKKHDTQ